MLRYFYSDPESRRKNQLSTILDQYSRLAESNPHQLRLLIPPKEVWRFFISGQQQAQGWAVQEKDCPGYLLASVNAYHEIFDMKNPLDNRWVKDLHRVANLGINERAAWVKDGGCDYRQYGSRRSIPILTDDNGVASQEGIANYIERSAQYSDGYKYEQDFHLVFYFKPDNATISLGFNIDRDTLADFKKFAAKMQTELASAGYLKNKMHQQAVTALLAVTNTQELSRALTTIATRAYRDAGVALCARSSLNHYTMNNNVLDEAMTSFMQTYEAYMTAASSPLARLQLIVKFIQRTEQLGPFPVDNSRTFCVLLLNHLLLKSGFPLAILHNPDRFRMHSLDELVDDVVQGMQNTLTLLASKQLYAVSTDTLLQDYRRTGNKEAVDLLGRCIESEGILREVTKFQMQKKVSLMK